MSNKKSKTGMIYGFRTVLVWAVLILMLLTLIGIMGVTTDAGKQTLASIVANFPFI